MKTIHRNRVISGTGLLLAACLFVASIILVNASITTWRIDLTENSLFTLSEGTINILDDLEEPVILDFYFSQKGLTGFPALANYGARIRDMLEEYVAHADGNIVLNVIDPAPFSEEEDQAVAAGLQNVSVNNSGDKAYFGLVGANSTDDERIIPFFQANREEAAEYDITKLIYKLSFPEQSVIGVMSSLPLFAGAGADNQQNPDWTIINALRELFEVRDLGAKPEAIAKDIDILMIVHPKDLSDTEYYELDQYLLKGGKAMIFLDPLAEEDRSQPDPENPNVLPRVESYFEKILDAWGMEIVKEKIVTDINAAMRVQARGQRGVQEINYLPWLRLTPDNFNREDFSSSELKLMHMGTVGSIRVKEDKGLSMTPLIQTSNESMLLERDLILFQSDPAVILNNFKSEDKKYVMAARIQGSANTAYPDGKHGGEGEDELDADFVEQGEINVVLVADSDMLADRFWIRLQNLLGISLSQQIANNGDFVINTIENLSGNSDLISLRGRGKYARPFKRVNEIRREAETKYRQREQELQEKLKETEANIRKLQQETGPEDQYILNKKQSREIEKFRQVKVETRKELRGVQHELQKNIENLGSRIRFINIGLIPLLITLAALAAGAYQSFRRVRR